MSILKITLPVLLGFISMTLSAQPPALKITHLTGSFYVYTTYKLINGNPFPSNSMYVVTDAGVVLIDTPWEVEQTGPLLDSIESRHGRRAVACIVTHSHDDRTGGLDIMRARGIETWSTLATDKLSRANGEKLAEHHFTGDTTFRFGRLRLSTWFPGAGHTSDNIVVWFPQARVLYGGCLVKSIESQGLGNIADADLMEWPKTMRKLIRKFKRPRFIIPGHQEWRSRRALEHTLMLLKQR